MCSVSGALQTWPAPDWAQPWNAPFAADGAAGSAAASYRPKRRVPPTLIIGAALVVLVLGVAILSFVWTPHEPAKLNIRSRLAPPGTPDFPLGTDRLGRDMLTQIMVGARNSLYVSIVSTVLALCLGTVIGLLTAAAGENVVRLLPPLIIGDAEISEAVKKFDAACSKIEAAQKTATGKAPARGAA